MFTNKLKCYPDFKCLILNVLSTAFRSVFISRLERIDMSQNSGYAKKIETNLMNTDRIGPLEQPL